MSQTHPRCAAFERDVKRTDVRRRPAARGRPQLGPGREASTSRCKLWIWVRLSHCGRYQEGTRWNVIQAAASASVKLQSNAAAILSARARTIAVSQ
jgi:hypothetical protein